MSLSCILMGQDNLLIQCGKYLLDNHHQIQWVVSPFQPIQAWCDKNNIPWVGSLNQLPIDREGSVDYFFSIVNGTLLKAADLKIARYGTINYHDSILPKYAGVNATSWAIINGETTHGISWHMVNEGIDEGDIVYQSSFSLAENETALTLNLRCFDEATKGFAEIIRMIESSSMPRKKQNMDARSYYGMNHVLPNLGFINWQTADAQSIHSLCRALNFGNYSNNLGTLKLHLEDDYLLVLDVEKSTQAKTSNRGGMLLALEKEGLLISTLSQPILIKKLVSSDGKTVTTAELIQRYGFKVNDQLPLLDTSLIQSNHSIYSKALSNEKFWLAQLNQVVDHGTYCDRIFDKDREPTELKTIIMEKSLTNKPNGPLYLLASLFVYLYRLNNYENSSLFLSHHQAGFSSLWSTLLPMTPDLQSDFTCKQVLETVSTILETRSKRGTYLSDIYMRQPSLMSLTKECMISVDISNGTTDIPKNSLIHFAINQETNELKIAHRLNTQFQGGVIKPLIANMSAHINKILQYMLLHPEALINELVFITEEEQQKLFAWSIGEYIPLPSNTINDLFEQRVRYSPNSPAIYQDDEVITYHQLEQEVEKTTAFINTLNVTPKTCIGICVDQSVSMVALILSIAKTGCICVPIDNHYSTAQIESIAMKMELRFIISTKPSASLLKSSLQVYDAHDLLAQQNNIQHAPNRSLPHQEIMLLIEKENGTQWSTLTHKNIINYAYWFTRTAHFTTQSILDLSSPLPLNILVSCLLAPLFVGGALAFGTANPQINPQQYLTHLQRQKASHLRLTTADWELLMTCPDEISQLSELNHLLLTADIEPIDKASTWLSFCPDSRFVIMPEARFA